MILRLFWRLSRCGNGSTKSGSGKYRHSLDHTRIAVEVQFAERFESDFAGGDGVKRIIFADANTVSGNIARSALTDYNVTGIGNRTSRKLYAQPLRFGIPSQFTCPTRFCMCHDLKCKV